MLIYSTDFIFKPLCCKYVYTSAAVNFQHCSYMFLQKCIYVFSDTVTRVFYYVDADNVQVNPLTHIVPEAKVITASLGYLATPYTGTDVVAMDTLYSLLVYSGVYAYDAKSVEDSILAAWNTSYNGTYSCFRSVKPLYKCLAFSVFILLFRFVY